MTPTTNTGIGVPGLVVLGLVVLAGLGTTAVIVGIQWAVVAFTTDPRAWGVALGVPALFAGSVIARLFSVTEIVHANKGTRR